MTPQVMSPELLARATASPQVETLGDAFARMKANQQAQALGKQQLTLGDLQVRKAQQDAADEAKYRQIVMNSVPQQGTPAPVQQGAPLQGVPAPQAQPMPPQGPPATSFDPSDAIAKLRAAGLHAQADALAAGAAKRRLDAANASKDEAQAFNDTQTGNKTQAALRNQLIFQATGALGKLPSTEARAQAWPQAVEALIGQGHLDPKKVPTQYPGDAWLENEHNIAGTQIEKDGEDANRRANELHPAAVLEGKAKAEALARSNAATQLGASKTTEEYQQVLDGLPYALAKQFEGKTAAEARQLGMTGDQQTTAGQAASNAADTKDYRNGQLGFEAARLNEERRKTNLQFENVKLTPEAIDKAAEMFANSGQLPQLGMGAAAAANRSAIINRAQAKFPNVDWGANKATFQANQDSLKSLQKNLDNVEAFEKTAGKNLDVFLDAAKKVPDTGSPVLNLPLRMVNDKLLGSPEASAFYAAGLTAKTEIAKVLNSANAGGVLSDSARKEVETMIGPDATLKQIFAAANILKQDMTNRHDSYTEQRNAIKTRLTGATNPQGAPESKPYKTYNPKTGKIE